MTLLQRGIFPLLFLLFGGAVLLAQPPRYFDQWYFGFGTGLDFRGGGPTLLKGPMRTFEGSAVICNAATGALLFYTDGVRVWDALHRTMPNGLDLLGDESSAQSALIVPKPKSPGIYYIFTAGVGAYVPGPNQGLRYSVVNMARNNGFGDVTEKNVTLLDSSAEMLNATRHCNGIDYWVMAHELGSSRFVAWLVTEDGITDTVISDIGPVLESDSASPSIAKFSPSGKQLAVTVTMKDLLQLYDFNTTTGELSAYRLIAEDEHFYGVEFSPDESRLYVLSSALAVGDTSNLYQFSLAAGSLQDIKDSRYRLWQDLLNPGGQLQMAPDKRIYTTFTLRDYVGAIMAPDQPGPACGYVNNAVFLDREFSAAGFPNCISAHFFGVTAGTGSADTICTGDSVQLHAWGDGPFVWTPTETLTCSDCPDPIAFPDTTTTYIVTDLGSCLRRDSITIVVVDPPVPDAGNDTVVCAGESVRLEAKGGVRYRWSPAAGLSCTDCYDPTASPTTTTTYVVVAANNQGCTGVDSVTVRVVGPPVADAGNDTTVCPGDGVRLQASGGLSYRWSPASGLSCTDCPDPVATPAATTTYEVVVTGESGCESRDEVTVTISGDDVRITIPDTAICPGESVRLGATGRTEYRWSPADGLSCTDCPDPVASPAVTTTYIVEGSVNGKCRSFDTVTVTVRRPTGDAGADTSLCLGDSIRLEATGGTAYTWTPAIDITCLNCADPVVFPRTSITYYVEIMTADGCRVRDSVHVRVQSGENVQASGDTAMCGPGTAPLSASGAESYRWSPAAGLSCTDCANPTASPATTTTYYVIGTSASGDCPSLDSVTVTVRDLPAIDAGSDAAICRGQGLRLSAGGGASYRWDPSPDLSCLDCADPIASPAATTTYYVTGTSADGCESRDSVRVEVRPGPVVEAGDDRTICIGDSLLLSVVGGERWEWSPAAGLSCTDCANPTAMPTETTTYYVRAWDAEGCEAVDSVTVNVREEGERLRLRIGRNYHGGPGEPIEIAVEMADDAAGLGIGDLEFTLEYDPGVMTVDPASIGRLLPGTLLSGWNVAIRERGKGRIVVRLTAPAGSALSGIGPLLGFEGRAYLSNVLGTELPFAVSGGNRCVVFETEAGYARVDSVCGLNLRLITLTSGKYGAPTVSPNPARDRVRFGFGLGLDGATRLEVFDLLGNRVGLLVNDLLQPGEYSVEWDLRDVPSGVYWYRLTSGDWSSGGQVRVER